MLVANCANFRASQKIICEPRWVDLAPCYGVLMHTSGIHLFVCFRRDDALACQAARFDCAESKSDCLTFDGLVVHLCLAIFSLAEYSSAQLASFSNGSHLFPTKSSSFSNAPLVPILPFIQTSARTAPPIRTALLRNSSAP